MTNEKPSTTGTTFRSIGLALVFLVLGFILRGSYEDDQARQAMQDTFIKRVAESVEQSIAPMRFGLQTDIKDAMVLCNEASFRSIRAADTVTKDFDIQKESIDKALKQ